jgi:uncharacterized protein
MKKIFLSAYCLVLACFAFAQQKEHKIVFDYTKADTTSSATLMRQVTNILIASPGSKIEIVCHGPGLDMIMTDKTSVKKEIEGLHEKFNVIFSACEATMKRRSIEKNQLLPFVITVPLANLEISSKQQEGWSYIKAGY